MPVIGRIVKDIHCHAKACGHVFTEYLTAEAGWKCPCPKCGAECSLHTRGPTRAFAVGNRPWHEEGRSPSFAFNPKALKKIGRTCPETARAVASDGTLVFENDRHQKKVYGEMAREKQHADAERSAKEPERMRAFLGMGQNEGEEG